MGQVPVTDAQIATLNASRDREQLAESAIAVASANDAKALGRLQELLGTREFLARLDDVSNPQLDVFHLRKVMLALQAHPSQATENLCLALAEDPDFTALPARLNYLLPALAAVRPLSARAAAVFRRTNSEGFFALNGPLLVANGSPRALETFEAMVADEKVEPESRADLIYRSVVPFRTSPDVLRAVERLIERKLESSIHIALLEATFEYDPTRWFGRIPSPPVAPAWEKALPEARKIALSIGRKAEGLPDLPPALRQAIGEMIAASGQEKK
jgi:hypothetical protein